MIVAKRLFLLVIRQKVTDYMIKINTESWFREMFNLEKGNQFHQ